MSLPALEALHRFDGSPLWVVTRSGAAAAYRNSSFVANIILEEHSFKGRCKLLSNLRAQSFSRGIVLPNSFSSALMAFLGNIPHRLGYRRNSRGFLLNKSVVPTKTDLLSHQSFFFLKLIESITGNSTFSLPKLTPPPLSQQISIPQGFKLAIAPGAAYGGAKRWPAENFAACAALILSKHPGTAVILGAPSEVAAAAQVQKCLERFPILNLAGQTNLDQALAVMAQCHLTLSNDSGLMHLSGALDVPVVAVFGPTNPLVTSPLAKRWSIVRNPCECSPCLLRECPKPQRICFEGITPEIAALEAFKLLSMPKQSPGALFWTPTADALWPPFIPENLQLIVNREDFKCPDASFVPPQGTTVLPGSLTVSETKELLLKNGLKAASCLWLADNLEALKNSAPLNGRAALVITPRSAPQIPQILKSNFLPDITVPNPQRALEWMAAL
jgi:heptosyltransferase-2